jgi:SAM-dependent methyltransferase
LLEAYDLVILMDVLEHLDDDLGFLSAALEHLTPGGIVAINVPAHMAFCSKYDEVIGHERRYNIARIESLFRHTNIEPLSIAYWGLTLLPVFLARTVVVRFVFREQIIHTGFAEHDVVTRKIPSII